MSGASPNPASCCTVYLITLRRIDVCLELPFTNPAACLTALNVFCGRASPPPPPAFPDLNLNAAAPRADTSRIILYYFGRSQDSAIPLPDRQVSEKQDKNRVLPHHACIPVDSIGSLPCSRTLAVDQDHTLDPGTE